jgi:hypothetical protein
MAQNDNQTRTQIYNQIWYEMVHAKFWEQYLSDYTLYKYDYRKWYNIITMLISVIGASTFPLWKLVDGKDWVPSIIFGAMAIAQILAVFQKNMVSDNSQLKEMIKLRCLYITYFNNLEKLYLTFNLLNENELIERYYQLREESIPIEKLKDSLNIRPYRKLKEKGEEKARQYLKTRYKAE